MADGDSILGAAGAQPAQPQFTKRKSFLGFKIKSKPIYAQQAQPFTQPRPQKKPMGRVQMGLLISIVIGVLSFFLFSRLRIGIIESAGLAVVVILLLAALTIMAVKGRRKSPAGASSIPQQAAAQAGISPRTYTAYTPSQIQEKKKPTGPLNAYVSSIVKRRKKLEAQLLSAGMRENPQEFVGKMLSYSLIISFVVGIAVAILFFRIGEPAPITLILAFALWFCIYQVSFNRFLLYPTQRRMAVGKLVERDVLFAARDIVVGMRSGMPLFNAIASVSTGYGETSKEFARIVELVQLGMPMEQAMDEVSSRSESPTFKRLMLQASVSIKAGVDVTATLQDVVDEAMQERVIDIRRYGQKLNALAMFYMLFGVIFPSMGVAVLTIMSTFISIFPVTYVILLLVLVFIAFIQIVLLNLMRKARPVFII